MSSYPDDVKASIEQLVSIMGGRYSTSLSKKNSHLLIRAAAGPKFAGCAARGVIPVTADWLIESAHAGMCQPRLPFSNVLTIPVCMSVVVQTLAFLFLYCNLVMSYL